MIVGWKICWWLMPKKPTDKAQRICVPIYIKVKPFFPPPKGDPEQKPADPSPWINMEGIPDAVFEQLSTLATVDQVALSLESKTRDQVRAVLKTAATNLVNDHLAGAELHTG